MPIAKTYKLPYNAIQMCGLIIATTTTTTL